MQVLPWRNPLLGLQLVAAGLAFAALWRWITRPSRAAALLLVSGIALELASFGLFAEWRNSPVPDEVFAFPSGHTLGTVIIFGFVCYVVFLLPLGYFTRIVSVLSSAILIVAVVPSRLFLCVHLPTDLARSFFLVTSSLFCFILIF